MLDINGAKPGYGMLFKRRLAQGGNGHGDGR
jgi:hypothetical protein